jgi:predicted nucleotidyltransferase
MSIFGKHLCNVILYGSYARGDFRNDSDIDILILVDLSSEEIEKKEEEVFDLAFDIEMKENIHISPIIINKEQFEYWNDVLPFYRNIKVEGVEIVG